MCNECNLVRQESVGKDIGQNYVISISFTRLDYHSMGYGLILLLYPDFVGDVSFNIINQDQ